MKSFCLHLNRRALLTLLMACCLVLPAFAQTLTVQGTVVDDKTGEPIIGANVIAKGTAAGAATDFDGNFQLSVSKYAVLTVSYIVYESQVVAVNGQTLLTVRLKENSVMLEEVVAIGWYGEERGRNRFGCHGEA